MNKIKLLSKLQDFFDSGKAKKKKDIKEIKSVLTKLKNKQLKTKKMLSKCKNKEFKKVLLLNLDVTAAQIDKGEKFLKELSDSAE